MFRKSPVNTYILNDDFKILNWCYESWKTCSNDKENDYLSCYKGYILMNGKCIYTNYLYFNKYYLIFNIVRFY